MMREELVRIAVEACEDDPFIDDLRYQGTTQQGARFEHYINVTLAAIEARGFAFVPREPTARMVIAGANERDNGDGELHARKWRAMLDAFSLANGQN